MWVKNLYRKILGDKKRRRKWLILLAGSMIFALMLVMESLVFELKDPNYINENLRLYVLLNFNIILVLGLVIVVFRNLLKLYFEHKQRVLGSRIKVKLVVSFISFSLIPVVVLFLVSSNLISSTIDNWFHSQNEKSLKDSLEIAQRYYGDTLGEAFEGAKELAQELVFQDLAVPDGLEEIAQLKELIKQKQAANQLGTVKIVFKHHKSTITLNNPSIPGSSLVKHYKRLVEQGLQGAEYSFSSSENLIDSVVPIFSEPEEKRQVIGAILFNYHDPSGFLAKTNRIKMVYENFAKRKSYKSPLKTTYLAVILVITLMILFAAIWGGFQLAKRITIPFQKLVEGTREVAAGNLEFEVEVEADDEIKILVDSFNQMTRDIRNGKLDLEKAYQDLKEANVVLDERREYIEALLKNVAAGVFSINGSGVITTVNRSVSQILGLKEEELKGKNLEEVFDTSNYRPLKDLLQEAIESSLKRVQRPLMLNIKNNPITLLVSITFLADPAGTPQGSVVVLEDLTQLIKAQKAAAWKEIARRMAHEIKNPLTPIKLNAQRLKKKYEEEASDYPQILSECTNAIVDEVENLKNLVNEFSRFSRMPVVKMKSHDLNQIITNTANLYRDHPSGVILETELEPDLPALQVDSQQMKQVLVNLIDNAISAFNGDKTVQISTKYDSSMQSAILQVADRGVGISASDKNKLFLPYFSTKKAGTGLGLSIIHKIVTDHRGYIRIEDNQPQGAKFIIEIPAVNSMSLT